MISPGRPDPHDAARDASRTLAVILAGGRGRGLAELCDREAPAALHMAGRRRLIDYALQEVERTGLRRALVLLDHAPGTLERHLPEAWGQRLDVAAERTAETGPGEALAHAAPMIDAAAAGTVVVLQGERAGAFDLPALLAAHRASGSVATRLVVPDGDVRSLALDPVRRAAEIADRSARGAVADEADTGPDTGTDWDRRGVIAFEWSWLRGRLSDRPAQGWDDLLGLARAEGLLAAHVDGAALWRDPRDPDAFRRAWLDLSGPVPFPLPRETGAADDPTGRPDLVMEAGGLTLTVPRFGARRAGRWTLLDETVVMPGARVAPGARLSRALIAPGAIVPAGLVIGEDPDEDARWFRACPARSGAADAAAFIGSSTPSPAEPPTILVTASMLARRAAERMRLQSGASLRSTLSPLESS